MPILFPPKLHHFRSPVIILFVISLTASITNVSITSSTRTDPQLIRGFPESQFGRVSGILGFGQGQSSLIQQLGSLLNLASPTAFLILNLKEDTCLWGF
ncbi:hypothetical protein Pint_04520 [Pistacia integerrima]|uniref:Uncharacterized protein n=1 Tax=Pistacia integerrima TaxID=434235 RepID=A0ACC0Z7I9_9ROSI|nr:hypothetical protein Pint_04520 [Pistacia integerrima]